MKPYKRFREVIEDSAGKRIPLATVTVFNADDTLAVLYADRDGTGGSIGSQVPSDAGGEVSFYAVDGQYKLVIAKTGFMSIVVKDATVGGGGLAADDFPMIDMRKAPYNIRPNQPDVSAEFQAAHDEGIAREGFITMFMPWALPLSRQIQLADVCNLEGKHMTESGTLCVADPTLGYFNGGSVFERRATKGVSGGGRIKQTMLRFRQDGNGLDRYKGIGTAIRGSDVITGVTLVLPQAQRILDQLNAGRKCLIDFYGGDTETLVIGKSGNNGNITLQLNKASLLNNGGAGGKNALTLRECVVLTGSAVAGSKTVQVSGGDVQYLRKFMRMSGSAFTDTDEEEPNPGLSSFDRIQSFVITGPTSATITTRDGAKQTSSNFQLLCWVETFGLEILKPPDDGKDYAGLNMLYVEARKFSGFAHRVNGMDQIHWTDCKIDSVDRGGVSASGCNDSFWERGGIGSTLFTCGAFRAGATPRYTGEAYLPYLAGQYCLLFGALKEGSLISTDVNGPIALYGKANPNDNEYPMVSLNIVNKKWFTSNKNQDPTERVSYLTIRNLIVNDIGGGAKWSQGAGTRPHYLAMGNGASKAILNVWCQNMVMDMSDPRCPFGVEVDPVNAPGVITGGLSDGTVRVNLMAMNERNDITMGDGTFVPTVSCVSNPESLGVSYTDQRGYWSRLPGGRVCLSVQITATITSIGTSPAAGGSLRLNLPPGIVPRSGYGGQRVAAAVEGLGVALGDSYTVNAVKVAEGGSVVLWKTGPGKVPAETPLGNFPIGQEFTVTVFGELLV